MPPVVARRVNVILLRFRFWYPLFINLENHCSIRQQKMVARVLRDGFGDALYIPPTSSDHVQSSASDKTRPLALMSPQDLIGKIIIAVMTSPLVFPLSLGFLFFGFRWALARLWCVAND